VKLGDNSKMMVMGKENIRLQVGGMTQVITEVYFAPELKKKSSKCWPTTRKRSYNSYLTRDM
jgi:hypothetical protein